MARLPEQTVALPDGATLRIRSAIAADAPDVLEYWRAAAASTDQIMTQPDEVPDLAEERIYLGKQAADPAGLFLLGLVDRTIVASLSMRNIQRRRAAHVVDLGLIVTGDWRGRGVGAALIGAALDWAAAHETIEAVSLCVFSTNARAEALYRRFGFVRDGVRPRHAQIRPGEYADDILMTLFVKPGVAPPGYNTYRPTGKDAP
ncbi:MAG: GNAT family N-acetyltransferase [Phycisphaerales bacterium JB039]